MKYLPEIVFAFILTLLVACAADDVAPNTTPTDSDTAAAAGEPLRTEMTIGPVTAIVTVTPAEPLIGDVMVLTLSVESKTGVQVDMPEHREAIARFDIIDFDTDRQNTADGERQIQTYSIQASSSGRMRIPPLRVVFTDTRPGQDADKNSEEQELLTDEISLKVKSVSLEEDEAQTLRPVRRNLEEDLGPGLWSRYWWAFGLLLVALVFLLLFLRVRRSRIEAYISPYERASVALGKLEEQGLPEPEALEAWYVQLSSIVRRYLEDRFGLRAPELTTEEFLRVAQRSVLLSTEHKALLSGFLADCDQVKFAGYEPGDEESQSVLQAARRFLLETREVGNLDEDAERNMQTVVVKPVKGERKAKNAVDDAPSGAPESALHRDDKSASETGETP